MAEEEIPETEVADPEVIAHSDDDELQPCGCFQAVFGAE